MHRAEGVRFGRSLDAEQQRADAAAFDTRREEIVQLLQDTAAHPAKCLDFQLSLWLNRYVGFDAPTNFTEAALLVVAAGLIYGRKVDHLEDIVHGMVKSTSDATDEADQAAANPEAADAAVVKQRVRRQRVHIKAADSDEFENPIVTGRPRTHAAVHDTPSVMHGNELTAVGEPYERIAQQTASNRPLAYRRLTLQQRKHAKTETAIFGRARITKRVDDDVDFACNYEVFVDRAAAVHGGGIGYAQTPTLGFNERPPLDRSDVRGWAFALYYRSVERVRRDFHCQMEGEGHHRNLERYRREVKRLLSEEPDVLVNYPNGRYLKNILSGRVCDAIDDNDNEDSELPAPEHHHDGFTDDAAATAAPPISQDSGLGLSAQSQSLFSHSSTFNEDVSALAADASAHDSGHESSQPSQRLSHGSAFAADETLPFGESTRHDDPDDIIRSLDPNLSIAIPDLAMMPPPPPQALSPNPEDEDAELQRIAEALDSKSRLFRPVSIDEGIGPSPITVRGISKYSPVVVLHDLNSALAPFERPTSVTIRLDSAMRSLIDIDAECPVEGPLPAAPPDGFPLPGAQLPRLPVRLAVNVLALPEGKLRRSRLLQLPGAEFALWDVAGKRKMAADGEPARKVPRLMRAPSPSAVSLASQWDAEVDGFAGFDCMDEERLMQPAADVHAMAEVSAAAADAAEQEEVKVKVHASPIDEAMGLNEGIDGGTVPPPHAVDRSHFADSGFTEANSGMLNAENSGVTEAAEDSMRPSEAMPEFNLNPEELRLPNYDGDDDTAAAAAAAADAAAEDDNGNDDNPSTELAEFDESKAQGQRVTGWHQSLRAVLAHSQAQNHFDIHEFGTHILDTVRKSHGDARTTFADVLEQHPRGSTSNYFLAMLQLVNFGNVELQVEGGEVDGAATVRVCEYSDLGIRLLSEQRHSVDIPE